MAKCESCDKDRTVACRVCGWDFQPEIAWGDVCPGCEDEWDNDEDLESES